MVITASATRAIQVRKTEAVRKTRTAIESLVEAHPKAEFTLLSFVTSLGATRTTVRYALDELEEKGKIFRVKDVHNQYVIYSGEPHNDSAGNAAPLDAIAFSIARAASPDICFSL